MRISSFIRELQIIERKYGNLDAKLVNVGPTCMYNIVDLSIGYDNDGSRIVFMGGATLESQYENVQGR